MKEIEDPFGDNFDKIESGSLSEGIEVPKKIILEARRLIRLFEVDGLDDLLENYQFLSTVSDLPKSFLRWKKTSEAAQEYERKTITGQESEKIVCNGLEEFSNALKELFEHLGEAVEYSRLVYKGRKSDQTINQLFFLENVYLSKFLFHKKKSYEAVEFDVSDKSEKSIRGVFVYRGMSQRGISDEERAVLEGIVGSLPATQFDLMCTALNEDYPIDSRNPKKIVTRGKKLLVHKIRLYEEGREVIEQPPYVEINSPIFSLV